jgi:hypothetical protein
MVAGSCDVVHRGVGDWDDGGAVDEEEEIEICLIPIDKFLFYDPQWR